MRRLPLFFLLVLLADGAFAQVPLPLPRPSRETIAVRPPAQPSAPRVPQASGPARSAIEAASDDEEAPCTELLAASIAEVELNTAVSGTSGSALCGDLSPVRMTAIHLEGGGKVELRPAAVARCGMALAFARWVRENLAPSVAILESKLRRIDIAASYHCRPRNNVDGARLSEHGLANAIDVGALHVESGKRIAIVNPDDAPPYLFEAMRVSACARFTTVLGPGADAAHADHIHLDLARRRNGYRLCQWPHAEWPSP